MKPALEDATFSVGLGMLLTHELDAVGNHEWRLLPLLRTLPDQVGMSAFVLAHVPLFAVLVALVSSEQVRVRAWSRLGMSLFLVAHAALHLWYSGDADYEFDSSLSQSLILGGAVLGALYVIVARRAFR